MDDYDAGLESESQSSEDIVTKRRSDKGVDVFNLSSHEMDPHGVKMILTMPNARFDIVDMFADDALKLAAVANEAKHAVLDDEVLQAQYPHLLNCQRDIGRNMCCNHQSVSFGVIIGTLLVNNQCSRDPLAL